MILPRETQQHSRDSAAAVADRRGPGGLSRAEERGLATRIAAGDRAARDALVQANLGLVFRIARRFLGRGLPMDDLVGEGNLGLIRAAESFLPGFGTRFSTYATYWIKDAILMAVMNAMAPVRVPVHMVKLLWRWRRAEEALSRADGQPPSCEEIAAVLGLSGDQKALVVQTLIGRQPAVLRPGDTEADSFLDTRGPTPEAQLLADEEREALRRRLERLDSRARRIITWHYGLEGEPPMTFKEIGSRLGVTKEWVRKIEQDALGQLVEGGDREGPSVHRRRPRGSWPVASPIRQPDPPARPAPAGPDLPSDPLRPLEPPGNVRRQPCSPSASSAVRPGPNRPAGAGSRHRNPRWRGPLGSPPSRPGCLHP